ncbi:hypothetical protein EV363DRAFT_1164342 [Boletus edulis]|uniref:Uncharacterized protein n=1 Tax=Boletus edulis BED1 TaxID=1328754 RepID=A0AAD4G8E9_BOLED|nr:hypothetical protein EV363DRAFT_1164342 [Boletus edulis]KAF8430683.1 hypothetical protein L210DRAFT_418814 [Boletus edulis BED1]
MLEIGSNSLGYVYISILQTPDIVRSPCLSDNSPVQSSHPLCGKSAGWVVKGIVEQGSQTTIAGFKTVTFTGASAGKRDQGLQGPFGANTVEFYSSKVNTLRQ